MSRSVGGFRSCPRNVPRDPACWRKPAACSTSTGALGGKRFQRGDMMICADANPSIQARHRIHPTSPAAPGGGQLVEHEYERLGAHANAASGQRLTADLDDAVILGHAVSLRVQKSFVLTAWLPDFPPVRTPNRQPPRSWSRHHPRSGVPLDATRERRSAVWAAHPVER